MSIMEKLENYFVDRQTRRLFDRDLWNSRSNQNIGKECGLKNLAINMLQANEPIENIKTFTGLMENDIKELEKSISNKGV